MRARLATGLKAIRSVGLPSQHCLQRGGDSVIDDQRLLLEPQASVREIATPKNARYRGRLNADACGVAWSRNPVTVARARGVRKAVGQREERGQLGGREGLPCAIVLAVDPSDPNADGRKQAAGEPITPSPPHDLNIAVEILSRAKEHPGLGSERPWDILGEVNVFTSAGFGVRLIKKVDSRVDYGMPLTKLF